MSQHEWQINRKAHGQILHGQVLYFIPLLHHMSEVNLVFLLHYICLTALVTFQMTVFNFSIN